MGFSNIGDRSYTETTATPYTIGSDKWGWTFYAEVSGGKATFELPPVDGFPVGTGMSFCVSLTNTEIEIQTDSGDGSNIVDGKGDNTDKIGSNIYGARIELIADGSGLWIVKSGAAQWYDPDDDDPQSRYFSLGGPSGDAIAGNIVSYNDDNHPIDSLLPMDAFGDMGLLNGISHRDHLIEWTPGSPGTLTITLSTDQVVYVSGKAVTITSAGGPYTESTWTPAGVESEDFYWVVDLSTVTPTVTLSRTATATSVKACTVYANTTDGSYMVMDTSPPAVNPQVENLIGELWTGVQCYESGYPVSWSTSSDSDNDIRFKFSEGTLRFLLRGFPLRLVNGTSGGAWEQDLGGASSYAKLKVLRITTNGFVLEENASDATFPFLVDSGTGRIAYETSGSQAAVNSGEYAVHFIALTNCPTSPLISIQGRNSFSDLAAAYRYMWSDHCALEEPAPDGMELNVIGRVIYEADDTYSTTGKVVIADYDDMRRLPTYRGTDNQDDSQAFRSISHNTLEGRQRDEAHPQYAFRFPGMTFTSVSLTVDPVADVGKTFVNYTGAGGSDLAVTLPAITEGMNGSEFRIIQLEENSKLSITSSDGVFVPGLGIAAGGIEVYDAGSFIVLNAIYTGASNTWVAVDVAGRWYNSASMQDYTDGSQRLTKLGQSVVYRQIRCLNMVGDTDQGGSPPAAPNTGDSWVVNNWGVGYNDNAIYEWDGAAWQLVQADDGGDIADSIHVVVGLQTATTPDGTFFEEDYKIFQYDQGAGDWLYVGPESFCIGYVGNTDTVFGNRPWVYSQNNQWEALSSTPDSPVLNDIATFDSDGNLVDGTSKSDAAPQNVTKDTAAAGSSADLSRADHKHDISTAAAGTIEPDDAAAEGAATSLARSDHQHAIATAAAGTIEPDDGAAEGSATSFSRSDHQHAIVTATAGTITPGDSAAEGSATSFSRSDHQHEIADFGTTSGTFAEGNDARFYRDSVAEVAAATYSVSGTNTNDILHVTYAGDVLITLTTAWLGNNGNKLAVKDARGNASIYNITIETETTETIDGTTEDLVINGDWDSVDIYAYDGNAFLKA